jgi:hypothetical protein
MSAARDLALAFVGSLCSAFALAVAIGSCEPFAAGCALATTAYCLAEFILRSAAQPDPR